MVELVQATPEDLEAFGKKCEAGSQEAETLYNKVVSKVEGVRAKWGGSFADVFGAEWAKWQKEVKEFGLELGYTHGEMWRLSRLYREADEEATAATKSVRTADSTGV